MAKNNVAKKKNARPEPNAEVLLQLRERSRFHEFAARFNDENLPKVKRRYGMKGDDVDVVYGKVSRIMQESEQRLQEHYRQVMREYRDKVESARLAILEEKEVSAPAPLEYEWEEEMPFPFVLYDQGLEERFFFKGLGDLYRCVGQLDLMNKYREWSVCRLEGFVIQAGRNIAAAEK